MSAAKPLAVIKKKVISTKGPKQISLASAAAAAPAPAAAAAPAAVAAPPSPALAPAAAAASAIGVDTKAHTIIFYQTAADLKTRSYKDFEAVDKAMDGMRAERNRVPRMRAHCNTSFWARRVCDV